jgi:hypothetical protein
VSRERRPQSRPRVTQPRGDDTKRRRVEEYLAGLNSGQLSVATDSSVGADMAAAGVAISTRYTGRILEEWRYDHGVPTPGGR